MIDYMSKKILEKKPLERWENEGGRICAEEMEIPKNGKSVFEVKKRLPGTIRVRQSLERSQ